MGASAHAHRHRKSPYEHMFRRSIYDTRCLKQTHSPIHWSANNNPRDPILGPVTQNTYHAWPSLHLHLHLHLCLRLRLFLHIHLHIRIRFHLLLHLILRLRLWLCLRLHLRLRLCLHLRSQHLRQCHNMRGEGVSYVE